MLIEFAVENYRSFKKLTKLSMLSTKEGGLSHHRMRLASSKKKIYANKLGILFGPNGSGKSNLLAAFGLMVQLVKKLGIQRMSEEPLSPPPRFPFRFDKEAHEKPTLFQVIFEQGGSFFRYGFTYASEGIEEEWLYTGAPEKENLVFHRQGLEPVKWGEDFKGEADLQKHITRFSLVLTVGTELKAPVCQSASVFFMGISCCDQSQWPFGLLFKDPHFYPVLIAMLQFADIGIENVECKEEPVGADEAFPKDMPEEIRSVVEAIRAKMKGKDLIRQQILFRHSTLGDELDAADRTLSDSDESDGTKTFLVLMYLLFQALQGNSLLLIDELEKGLHPLLVAGLLKFFTTVEGSRAQLLCGSHCSVIFSQDIVRRDELWIVEKDRNGESFLQSAVDFEASRADANLTRRYLEGRFGGIPLLEETLLEQGRQTAEQALRSARDKAVRERLSSGRSGGCHAEGKPDA